jgi:hypothetical protein
MNCSNFWMWAFSCSSFTPSSSQRRFKLSILRLNVFGVQEQRDKGNLDMRTQEHARIPCSRVSIPRGPKGSIGGLQFCAPCLTQEKSILRHWIPSLLLRQSKQTRVTRQTLAPVALTHKIESCPPTVSEPQPDPSLILHPCLHPAALTSPPFSAPWLDA